MQLYRGLQIESSSANTANIVCLPTSLVRSETRRSSQLASAILNDLIGLVSEFIVRFNSLVY